jgi:hypothetical protein
MRSVTSPVTPVAPQMPMLNFTALISRDDFSVTHDDG